MTVSPLTFYSAVKVFVLVRISVDVEMGLTEGVPELIGKGCCLSNGQQAENNVVSLSV